MPELFNGTPQTTIAGDERFAFNKPGVAGSKNITFANLIAAILGVTPSKGQITNGDLNSGDNYSYTINHGNNTLFVGVALYDSDGVQQSTDGIFQIIDSNNVKFTFNGEIAGTWRYILTFF
jgi:hypothetical protein